MPALDDRVAQLVRERDSWLVDLIIIVGTVAAMWLAKGAIVAERMGAHTSWLGSGEVLSRAGWWYCHGERCRRQRDRRAVALVALHLTRFLVGFLRPRLVVSPGHPDLHGGLAVPDDGAVRVRAGADLGLGHGVRRLGFELLYDGATLDVVKLPAAVVMLLAVLVMFLPLLMFSGRISA